MNRSKLLKMLVALCAITVIFGSVVRLANRNSMTLAEYASQHPAETLTQSSAAQASSQSALDTQPSSAPSPASKENLLTASGNSSSDLSESTQESASQLIGTALNGETMTAERTSLDNAAFYYEPLSDNLCRYITGVSYPAVATEEEKAALAVDYEDLRYVHVLHYDFEGNPVEGELICNVYIAQDFIEIFYELYRNEYQIEKMVLIDTYDGDDIASMEDNNTSCFNYRVVAGSSSLSKHALGLAIDINPYYNPYVAYEKDGTEMVSPAAAFDYADRSGNFPYKIDETDLCYRLFTEHGFTWGGNWNSVKDYQHFQKVPKTP